MRKFLPIVIALMLSVGIVRAQDLATNTPEPTATEGAVTPEVTVAAPVVIVPATPAPVTVVVEPTPSASDNNTIWVVIVFGLMFFGTVRDFLTHRSINTLVTGLNKILDSRQLIEAAQQRYMESSMDVKHFVGLLHSGISFANAANIPGLDSLVDKVDKTLTEIEAPAKDS